MRRRSRRWRPKRWGPVDAHKDWRWRRDVAKVTEGLADAGTLGDQVVEMLQKSPSRIGSFVAAAMTGAGDRLLRGGRRRDLLPLTLSVESAEDIPREERFKTPRAARSRTAWLTAMILALNFLFVGGVIRRARVLGPPYRGAGCRAAATGSGG